MLRLLRHCFLSERKLHNIKLNAVNAFKINLYFGMYDQESLEAHPIHIYYIDIKYILPLNNFVFIPLKDAISQQFNVPVYSNNHARK